MQILVNHLTRMKSPYICVAGVNLADGSHVRPVLDKQSRHGKQIHRDTLTDGLFGLGKVVDLGPVTHRPENPQREDHLFALERIQVVSQCDPLGFSQLMESIAKKSLALIFGTSLQKTSSRKIGILGGLGECSLGVYKPKEAKITQEFNQYGKHEVRLEFEDPDLGDISSPITDIRLWEDDQITPNKQWVEYARGRLSGCVLAMGLGREYRGKNWLQVNNIFLADDPFWEEQG